MKQLALVQFPLVWLTCIGLLCFMVAFCMVIYRAYAPKFLATHQATSKLPLED